jgi:hypothetical protein
MPIVDEKKETEEKAVVKESGCCGGVSSEAAKIEEKKVDACSTEKLDQKAELKVKSQGSSCCG